MLGKTESEATGSFWLPADPEGACPGTLSIAGTNPRIELFGELSPWTMFSLNPPAENANSSGSSDDDRAMTVLGSLSTSPGKITVFNATTRRRSRLLNGPATQIIQGEHCIIGAHIPSTDYCFSAIRIRLSTLEEWAVLGGLEASFDPSTNDVEVSYSLPDTLEHTVNELAGTLKLVPVHYLPQPTVRGLDLKKKAWLEWRPDTGQPFERLMSEFTYPMRTLFTILFNSGCTVEELEILDPEQNRWLPVVGQEVSKPSDKKLSTPLLTRESSGLELLGTWLIKAKQLSPASQILASAIADSTAYVEAEILILCTAAEGLHRRLFPTDRRLTEDNVQEVKELINQTAFPGESGKILHQAMDYLWEPSFPMRVLRLATLANGSAPEITGRTNRWKQAITDARNGNAHSLSGRDTQPDYWEETLILTRSLRWLLSTVLLLSAGISETTLRSSLGDSRDFINFKDQSARLLPRIYSPDTP